jgi:succinoglycan biosynthesis protein ExoV
MKLHYYKSTQLRNFGDDLNEWLWPRLMPELLDDDDSAILLGIGTILNDVLNETIPAGCQRIAVLSSGVGYGSGLPRIDGRWKIYCLRGPLSAKSLQVPESLAVTDGAALLRRVYAPPGFKNRQFSYMPHALQSESGGREWQRICHDIDFGYIDARWPISQILAAISGTGVILTEAMHGAIAADALRIPWIPVHSTARILRFKWEDWCMSVGVNYRPKRISSLWGEPPYDRRAKRVRQWLKRPIIAVQRQVIATELARIAETTCPCLSSEARIEELTQMLEEKVLELKKGLTAGRQGSRRG